MSNSPSVVDFSIPLATFLATVVSDGTFSDVVVTEKTDEVGLEATATAIPVAMGQLLSNLMDDFFLAMYASVQGQQVIDVQTTNATADISNILATLTVDGDATFVSCRVQAKTGSAAEVISGSLSGLFYRTGGAVLVMNPGKTLFQVGLAGVDIDLDISGDDVRLEITGIAATTIQWQIFVSDVKDVVAP